MPATHVRVRDYSRDGVLRSLESSLERLGLDRVDIVFVHDPDDHYREALEGAFPALRGAALTGRDRAPIGAGMNQSEMLADFVRETDLDIVMLAGRYTLLEQGALDDLLPACERRGVSVVAAGVFNSGLLRATARARTRPTTTSRRRPSVLARVHRIADVVRAPRRRACRSRRSQFALAHPAVATVCLGARSAEQVERNAALFDVPVPDGAWAELVSEGLLRPDAPRPGGGS